MGGHAHVACSVGGVRTSDSLLHGISRTEHRCDPHVLSQAESPVAVIANVGNWHFYALEPDNPTYNVEPLDVGSADDALLAWSANSSLHEWQDNIANVTEAECSRSYGAPESHTEYDAQLFKLGESLMSADLFGNITCDQELSQLVASQDASDASNVDDNCFMVLRWRDAVKSPDEY